MSSTHGSAAASRIARIAGASAAAACVGGAVLLTLAITSESPPAPPVRTQSPSVGVATQERFVPIVATVTPTVSIPDLCDAAYCDAFGDPFSHASCTLNTLICGGPEVTPAFARP